jgi:3-dehydroquinate synthase
MSEPIWVNVQGGAYPVFVGHDLFAHPRLFQQHLQSAVCIISHPEIAAHYFPKVEKALVHSGVNKITTFLIPSGDQHKTLAFAEKIWSFLLTQQYHRDTSLIALGGGMIGDLVGYSAACYMRGVDVIQCPTSLLAQVDAAIGGKTAVNHPLCKNAIGHYHQPKLVLADVSMLATLPTREFIAGLAEIIKYGVILDPSLFEWLEAHLVQLLTKDQAALEYVVRAACRIKAGVVSQDEKEAGLRLVLNFGHTIAHAIENIYHYEKYLHGEAVAMGMIVAMRLSLEMRLAPENLLDRLISMLAKAGLPTSLPDGITAEAILTKIQLDKKHLRGKIRWVLVESLGQTRISEEVPITTLRKVLMESGATL